MKIVSNIEELQNSIIEWKQNRETIGFVPTMGFLHDGHLLLVKNSRERCSKTIVSIFVNPTQFNDPEDYNAYPMDVPGDLAKCESAGVDLVFLPKKETLYPDNKSTIKLIQEDLQRNLCGRTRPGHFEGVMLIVAKLFHLVSPNIAFFGLKDYQQFRIIENMVELLDFPLQVVGIPTLRESDGLAMSSRNVKLNQSEREIAGLIPRMYAIAEQVIRNGEKNLNTFYEILKDVLLSSSKIRIDYLEAVDPNNLQLIENLESDFVLALAVFVGKTRLIDNKLISKRSLI